MSAFLYKWSELSTGKWYIGSRTAKGCHPDDGYVCSSKIVRPLIQANPSDWRREILFVDVDPEFIVFAESELLQKLDAKNDPMSYNRHNNDGDGVFSTAGIKMSEEHKAKLSAAGKGKKKSEEHKAKISAARKAYWHQKKTAPPIVPEEGKKETGSR
jgi:hypothetical protein